VDLVDRHVDVLVIGIAVAHRDVLVLGEPQRIDEFVDNQLELPSFEAAIVGVERNDEVIRALAAGPRVLHLDRLDERTRKLEVASSANPRQVGGVEPSGSRLGASPLDVVCQMSEPLV
jgi:hypothetical protein